MFEILFVDVSHISSV